VQTDAHPFLADIDAERHGWYAMSDLVRTLSPDECLRPGYWHDPDWSVRDVVGHLGAWLAEGAVQFERMIGGTYEGHDVDIDGLNAQFLAALHDQPWEVVWLQANAARTRMLQVWVQLRTPDDEAAWWIRKTAVDHYGEHLPRLREWVAELIADRG
jgi:hypothetical protein